MPRGTEGPLEPFVALAHEKCGQRTAVVEVLVAVGEMRLVCIEIGVGSQSSPRREMPARGGRSAFRQSRMQCRRRGRLDVVRSEGQKELRSSDEHTSELQSLMRISYAVFCLKNTHMNHSTVVKTASHT